MSNRSSEETLAQRDYQHLKPEYRMKADRYVRMLMKLQRAEGRVEGELRKRGFSGYLDSNEDILCSFCGKPATEASHMIAADKEVYICDECVGLCADILKDVDKEETK